MYFSNLQNPNDRRSVGQSLRQKISPLPFRKKQKSASDISSAEADKQQVPMRNIPDIVVRQPPSEDEKQTSKFRRPSLKLLPPSKPIDQNSESDNLSPVSETSNSRDKDKNIAEST